MINCIAIDDEPLALNVIKTHCDKISFVNLKENFLSSVDALDYVAKNEIDVIFLDINMPELNGLNFTSLISEDIQVVFITAYEAHALESYDIGVTDYILKPVSFDRLYQSAQRCDNKKQQRRIKQDMTDSSTEPTILVKSDKKVVQIRIAEINYVEGLKDYAKIFFGDNQKVIIRESLMKIHERLKPQGFIRTHRSYIVPIHKITAFSGNTIIVTNKELPVSKSNKAELISIFKQKGILGDRSE